MTEEHTLKPKRGGPYTAGETHGRLTLLEFHHQNERRLAYWLASCSCGSQPFVVRAADARHGAAVSCGCVNRERASSNIGGASSILKRPHDHSNRTSRVYLWLEEPNNADCGDANTDGCAKVGAGRPDRELRKRVAHMTTPMLSLVHATWIEQRILVTMEADGHQRGYWSADQMKRGGATESFQASAWGALRSAFNSALAIHEYRAWCLAQSFEDYA